MKVALTTVALAFLVTPTASTARRARLEPPDSQPLLAATLAELGAEFVRDSTFDVLWLSETQPFDESTLRPQQLVTRIPGLSTITRKHHLASVARTLGWNNTPATLASAADFVAHNPTDSPPFSWLTKSVSHRGVSPIHTVRGDQLPELRLAGDEDNDLVGDQAQVLQARVVDPLLIDGTEFDMGVYVVAVQQAEGGAIQFEIFDDVLLRFCRAFSLTPTEAAELYEGLHKSDPRGAAAALLDAWVVDDRYQSAWQMAALQPSLARPNGTAATALAAVLRSRGLNWRHIWHGVEAAVASALAVPSIGSGGAGGVGGAQHYDLLRFDFKLDVRGKPWLLEVNSNPNLVPKSDEQAAVLRRLCRFLWEKLTASPPSNASARF